MEKLDYEVAKHGCLDEKKLPGFQFFLQPKSRTSSPVTCNSTTVPMFKVCVMEVFTKVAQDQDNSTVPMCKVHVMVLFTQVAWEEDVFKFSCAIVMADGEQRFFPSLTYRSQRGS